MPNITLDFSLLYVLDVSYLRMDDFVLDGLLDGLEPSLLDDLRFGKIDNSLNILIDKKLDVC